jgi:hypothetical protein
MRVQPSPIDLKVLAEEAAKGTSAQRIAARYGRSVKTITAIASRAGIAIKTPKMMKDEARRVLSGNERETGKKAS